MAHQASCRNPHFFPITQQEHPITPYLGTSLNFNHLQLLWVLKFSLLEKEITALPFPAALIFMPFVEQFHWLHRSLSGFTPVQKWGKKTWPLVWNIRFINASVSPRISPFTKVNSCCYKSDSLNQPLELHPDDPFKIYKGNVLEIKIYLHVLRDTFC